MPRLIPLAARSFVCLAALGALASGGGCISPAQITAVEGDTIASRSLPPPAVDATRPQAGAQRPDSEEPVAAPIVVAVRPLVELPVAESLTAVQQREALPPPSAGQEPQSPAEALVQPAAPRRVKAIQEISLDITPVASGQDVPGEIKPPPNEGAAALVALAGEQPFTRGEEIDYGFDLEPIPGGLEVCYQPLYFQELNAERYGRSWGILQPAVSVANFYGRIPLLPYMAVSRPARRCTYHAHWSLPGYRTARREPHPLVISPAGGAAQTAALFGVILLIP